MRRLFWKFFAIIWLTMTASIAAARSATTSKARWKVTSRPPAASISARQAAMSTWPAASSAPITMPSQPSRTQVSMSRRIDTRRARAMSK